METGRVSRRKRGSDAGREAQLDRDVRGGGCDRLRCQLQRQLGIWLRLEGMHARRLGILRRGRRMRRRSGLLQRRFELWSLRVQRIRRGRLGFWQRLQLGLEQRLQLRIEQRSGLGLVEQWDGCSLRRCYIGTGRYLHT
jgi:hypothetical protein